jgi:hypothetical protein
MNHSCDDDCVELYDCTDCVNCGKCSSCFECKHCVQCAGCVDCTSCILCYDLHGVEGYVCNPSTELWKRLSPVAKEAAIEKALYEMMRYTRGRLI